MINKKTVTKQAYVLPKVEGVPRYKDFNTIRKNHHVKDEEVLHFIPYFGETDDVDLTDSYKVEVVVSSARCFSFWRRWRYQMLFA